MEARQMAKTASQRRQTMVRETVEGEVNPGKTSSGNETLQTIMSRPSRIGDKEAAIASSDDRIDGVVIGSFLGLNEQGEPLVEFPGFGENEGLRALATSPVRAGDEGREVALSFVDGRPGRPLILGFIQQPSADASSQSEMLSDAVTDVSLDGESLTFQANRQIVLKCGKSSITLTRAGKIIIKGAYLSSRSSGVNRIKGGSVQIN